MSAMDELAKLIDKHLRDGTTNVSALARDAGCSRQSIYNILSGERQVSLPMAESLARCLGAEISIKEKIPA